MASRLIGELGLQNASRLGATSVLLLPLGATEQHGPHLPLDTDTVLAEAFTRAIVERWGDKFDLWPLPVVRIGLSREHAWAPGTQSLSVQAMTALLRDLGGEIVAALPARNLLIVNAHGGNRGILEALVYELRDDFGLNVCAIHTGAMMSAPSSGGVPDIHAGKDETSVMLAVAPHLVRRDGIAKLRSLPDAEAVRAAILDPAVTWPWSSGDARIADQGVTGDASAATAELGRAIVARVVEAAGGVIQQLLDNQKAARR
jgi:creatinine amidohydrolase/Fe(II)-dependent formamide hydrolase-like protein